ncbi:MAG: ABC transporter substrate-binding protein [Acidimicrobiia bacterium]
MRGKRSWKVVGVAVLAAGAAVLTACTGADSASGGGKYLRYGYDLSAQFTNTFDPAKSTGDCDQVVTHFIYDSLLRRDENTGKPIPGLAKSWEVTGDAKRSITFHLRDDVVFSDGTKMDANAVKASLEHNKKNSQLTTLSVHVDSIDVLDPLTVRVNLKDDQSTPFLYVMGLSRDGMIESPKALAGLDKDPVGSGPFMLKSFSPGESIVLVKNPKYWDKTHYRFPGINFLQSSTGPPAVLSFKAGDLDLVRFEAESLPTMRKDSSAKVVTKKTEAFLRLEFRYGFSDGRTTPFANPLVRQAVAYAIDKKKINDVVQLGEGEVASQALPKSSPGYNPSLEGMYPFSPQKAKDLLTQAGYPNGFTFTMAIPGPGIQNMQSMGELIQSMLKDVGITANIKPIAGSDIATSYYINGAGDAFSAAQLASSFYPGAYYDEFGKFQYVPTFNHAENQQITDLTLQAQAAQDPQDTARDVQQAAKIVMDGAMEDPIAFMPQFLAVAKDRVGGTIGGQRNICDPPDLSGVVMKGEG